MEFSNMKQLFSTLVPVLILISYISADDLQDPATCLNGCKCPDAWSAKCSGVAEIPNFPDKSLIKSLSIESHNISVLKMNAFENFTHLEQLYMNNGVLRTIEPGVFEAIKDTVKLINFRSNGISDINSGVFTNLPEVHTIVLNTNHLTTLKADSFVNMPKLETLEILTNHLDSIDKAAFKDLPELDDLNLFNNHFTEIPFDSLANLQKLRMLVLTSNKIKTVPEKTNVFIPTLEDVYLDSNPILELRVFPNISKSLTRLDLQFTNISKATKDTWKYLSELDQLNIGGTLFQVITHGTFEGLPKLKKLLLRDMPILTSIGPDAFRGIRKATTIDIIDCKKLSTIDESAFMSVEVTSFFLKGSGVSYIPEKLLKWSELHTLVLGHNPINCDCKIAWMLDSSIFGNNTSVKQSFDELVCATPKHHAGTHVTSLHPANLTCRPIPSDHPKRFVTGVVIAVICLVFFTTFALLVKFRSRIMISCRRYYQYRRYKNDLVFTVEHDTSIAELEDTDCIEGRPLKDMRLETVPIET